MTPTPPVKRKEHDGVPKGAPKRGSKRDSSRLETSPDVPGLGTPGASALGALWVHHGFWGNVNVSVPLEAPCVSTGMIADFIPSLTRGALSPKTVMHPAPLVALPSSPEVR